MVIGAGFLHLTSFGVGDTIGDITWSSEGIVALLSLGVVPSVLGYLVFIDRLNRLGPVEVNLVSFANLVFAAIIGRLILGERLAPVTVAGFVVVWAGFSLLKYRSQADRLTGNQQKTS